MYITACKVENNICKSQVEQLTMGQNAHFVWGKMPTGHFSRHFPPHTRWAFCPSHTCCNTTQPDSVSPIIAHKCVHFFDVWKCILLTCRVRKQLEKWNLPGRQNCKRENDINDKQNTLILTKKKSADLTNVNNT